MFVGRTELRCGEMDNTHIASVKWPPPWGAIADEHAALALGRRWGTNIASTVLEELHREICESHPLFGIDCVPIAYDTQTPKEFLFVTNKPDLPVVLVHFTWRWEPDPRFPFIVPFKSIEDFITKERKHRKKWWQFWI